MAISSNATGLRPGVCTSTTRPTNPYTGQLIFQTDTGTMHNWDGAAWQFLAPTQQRNLLYNGAMQVAQRNTSVPSITGTGYQTADRWNHVIASMGTWTSSVENDAPTGSGFRKSLKLLCTTADASPSAGDLVAIQQALEGQDVQAIRKGTSQAQQLTLSFWVKTNVTGTYVAELYDNDSNRQTSKTYTVSASGTWEFKTITFAADTTGQFDNNNDASLTLTFWLGAGSNFTSGTLQTTWANNANANRAVGQVNVASATNNYWQVTGVQLNVGSVAAPFEFKSFGEELAECQRYYYRNTANNASISYATFCNGTTVTNAFFGTIHIPVTMRTAPTSFDVSAADTFYLETNTSPGIPTSITTTYRATPNAFQILFAKTGLADGAGRLLQDNFDTAYIGASAEL